MRAFDVLLISSRADAARVEWIRRNLRRAHPFWSVRVSDEAVGFLLDVAERAQCVVLLWSARLAESRFANALVEHLIDRGASSRIVLCSIDGDLSGVPERLRSHIAIPVHFDDAMPFLLLELETRLPAELPFLSDLALAAVIAGLAGTAIFRIAESAFLAGGLESALAAVVLSPFGAAGTVLCSAAASLSIIRHVAEFRAAASIVHELTTSSKNTPQTGGAMPA